MPSLTPTILLRRSLSVPPSYSKDKISDDDRMTEDLPSMKGTIPFSATIIKASDKAATASTAMLGEQICNSWKIISAHAGFRNHAPDGGSTRDSLATDVQKH